MKARLALLLAALAIGLGAAPTAFADDQVTDPVAYEEGQGYHDGDEPCP